MNNTKKLLRRDLQNCFTISDIIKFEELLNMSQEDLSAQSIVELRIEYTYRLNIILLKSQYKRERYPACDIWRYFQNATSLPLCDAILLHVEQNKHFYTSEFSGMAPLSSIAIFERMYNKRVSTIIQKIISA